MLLDLSRLCTGEVMHSQVCIVGGGIAGLIIAMELERAGIASIVLESGGLKAEEATRDLNRGSSSGDIDYHYGDGCRSRYLGGSSNCWGGFCRAFDESDMATRSWVPNSGWPISHSDLVPYFKRAHEWLELGPYNYDTEHWVKAVNRPDVKLLPLEGSGLTDAVSQFSPPVRFGKRYRAHLKASRLITVVLHANLTRFNCDADGVRVDSVQATSLNQRQLTVHATQFVLAAGGIENSRLLLACSPQHPDGLGNQHDQVGRYYMDHPRMLNLGKVQHAPNSRPNQLYDTRYNFNQARLIANGTRVAAQLMPTAQVNQREGLTNAGLWFRSEYRGEHSPQEHAIRSLNERATSLLRRRKWRPGLAADLAAIVHSPMNSAGFVGARLWPQWRHPCHALLVGVVEPVPRPESRITLTKERDALGLPRPHIAWQIGAQERRTFAFSQRCVEQLLKTRSVGEFQPVPHLLADENWRKHLDLRGTWHHMGGTRMHTSPLQGVVDQHCKLHGSRNTFVAGSSVFPTGGMNFPTINLVALAVRLAAHLSHGQLNASYISEVPQMPTVTAST